MHVGDLCRMGRIDVVLGEHQAETIGILAGLGEGRSASVD